MKDDPLLIIKIRLDAARQQLDGVLRQVQRITRKLDAAVEQLWHEVRRVPVRPHHNLLDEAAKLREDLARLNPRGRPPQTT